jgi:hypothetical protein
MDVDVNLNPLHMTNFREALAFDGAFNAAGSSR